MPFSPHEIENREFVVAFRGYDRAEVRAFLRAVAADYRAALGEQRRAEIAKLDSLSELLHQVDGAASRAAESLRANAQRSAEEARRRAEEEAAELRRELEREGDRIRDDARRQGAEIRAVAERMARERLDEIARQAHELEGMREKMRQRFHFLETALQLARQDFADHRGVWPSAERQSELPQSAEEFFTRPAFDRGRAD